MKAQFFMNMNEMAVNKNDELKYLILMREEYFKYKLKLYYFRKWKSRALYNRDLIDEEDPFNPKNAENNYQQFKSMNYIGQGGIYDSINSKGINNFSDNKDNIFNSNINNKNNNFDLINFDEDGKKEDNKNANNNIYDLTGSNLNFGKNQDDKLNSIFNSIGLLKNKAMSNENLSESKIKNDNNNYDGKMDNNDNINLNERIKNIILNDNIFNNKNLNDKINNNINISDQRNNSKDEIYNNKNLNDRINNKVDLNDAFSDGKNLNNKINNKVGLKDAFNDDKNLNNKINNKVDLNDEFNDDRNLNDKINNNINSNDIMNKNIFTSFKDINVIHDSQTNLNQINDGLYDTKQDLSKLNTLKTNKSITNNDIPEKENINNNNLNKINNLLTGSKISFGPEQNQQLNNILNNIDILKSKAGNGDNLLQNKNSNDNLYNIKNSSNKKENYDSMKNFNDLLISNKNSNMNIQDSIKVLEVQKNINDALNNTNTILTKISKSSIKNRESNKKLDDNNNINDINELVDKNGRRFDDFQISKNNNDIIPLKTNNSSHKSLTNLINENSSNKNDKIVTKKNINNKYSKNIPNSNINKNKNEKSEEDEDSKNQKMKNFDIKKLYRYKSKGEEIDNQEKLKYKNSKYISTKYKDYLHTREKINKSKSKNNNLRDKLNDIYKEIQNNLLTDEALLKKLERNESSSNVNNNHFKNKYNKSKNKIIPLKTNKRMDVSADRIRDKHRYLDNDTSKNSSRDISIDKDKIKEINNLTNYYNQNKSNKLEDNLLKNGFFMGKNRKDKSLSNKDNDDELSGNDKINQILEKYKMGKEKEKDEKMRNKNIVNDNNYDYVKKIKCNVEGLYGKNINNKIINNKDYDNEYEELFHPKTKKRYTNNEDINNQLDTSDYSNSVYNILNNLDNQNNNIIGYNNINNYGYDDLINSITEPRISRINKRKVSRDKNKEKNKKRKKSYISSGMLDDSKNKSYVLAPMKGIPITNISFRARMKYFNDKKEKNMEKLRKEKKEEEKQIYTFQPKTGDNRLNVIQYSNQYNTENNSKKKKKVDYNRINNLYLDYKDKKNKIDELTKEYYRNAGISFMPKITDKNQDIKQYKNKLGQIPYLDRIEIYNASKQPYKAEKNIQFYQTEIF